MPVFTHPTVSALAAALGAKLTAAGIRTLPYLSDTFTPPIALVGIDTIDYHVAFGFKGIYTFQIWLILARSSDRAAIASMEAYMDVEGSKSVRQLLESDGTLGGIAEYVKVTRAGPPQVIQIKPAVGDAIPYVSVLFTVEVSDA